MIDGRKIEQLAVYYANKRGVTNNTFNYFCMEEKLGYTKWTTYKNKSNAKWTGLLELIRIFPNLNLNWLFKDIGPMMLDEMEKNDFNTTWDQINRKLEDLKAFHDKAKADDETV